MFGTVLKAYFEIFFIKKKTIFLLYLIQFYTDFLSQSKHLQIEVGGWCGWFRHLE